MEVAPDAVQSDQEGDQGGVVQTVLTKQLPDVGAVSFVIRMRLGDVDGGDAVAPEGEQKPVEELTRFARPSGSLPAVYLSVVGSVQPGPPHFPRPGAQRHLGFQGAVPAMPAPPSSGAGTAGGKEAVELCRADFSRSRRWAAEIAPWAFSSKAASRAKSVAGACRRAVRWRAKGL